MLHFSQARVIAVVLICLAALLFAMPNFFSKETVARWPGFLPRKQLALGLDLKGGAHLLLAMDTETLRKDWVATLSGDARKQLRDAKIGFSAIGVTGSAVQVRLAKAEDADAAVRELRKLNQSLGSALLGTESNSIDVQKGEGGVVTLHPTAQGLANRVSGAASAALETVRRRVDIVGTTEPLIVRQGSDRILVQVPGFDDTRRLKELIGNTAKLSFHEVHPQMTPEEVRATRVPIGYKIYPSAEKSEAAYLLRETPVVPGDDLVDAQPGFDSRTNEPVINFRFNQSGARRFGAFTRDHVNQPFAIVLDDKVLSAPNIREPILGGSGQISGSFTIESANTLAVQLRSGALPTKLTVIEERTVGPSLGADSVEAGTTAGVIGMIATVIMTVTAYGTFGVIAVVGLAVHAISILALMSAIGTTLTLPGIAGFVLTISMAVDANVLIYERIREELRAGKTAVSAIEAGFTRAFVAIFDSQLTTLAAAVIMFWLGSGPIRGFAVTLTLGILTSVFAAVTVTRMLVSFWLRSARTRSRAIEVPI
jgi:preprotein translocase subunit SecD